jgi:hypothetical protein
MAGRILNRRELRKQADEAEVRESPQDTDAADEDDVDEAEDSDDAGGDEDEEPGADTEDGADDESPRPKKAAKKTAKAKAPAAKTRKPRKPKAAPRMRARWGVFDSLMRQVAIFDYNQRAAADEKVAELAAKKNASFFVQLVKETMPEPAHGDGPGPQAK